MYGATKVDVDRHVEECLKKINNETERNLRCFTFAKQYFKIERYEDARKYVSAYLSAKPNSAEGHYLLGRCLEMLGKKEAAFQAYSTSLRLDPKQNNLVIKVCELLASDDVELDQSGAKHFCEMAQSFDPHNPAVFSLKQRIIMSSNDDPRDVSNLLLKELETRPADVKLRVRLLKHLLNNNMIREAYKHASDIESKDLQIFLNSLSWYEVVAEVLVKYQKSTPLTTSLGWEFWFLSVAVWDRLVSLSLDEHGDNIKTSTEYITAVFNYDQTFLKATQNLSDCPDKQLVQEFINHYRGQLCFHLTTLVFKQASKDFIKYKEASNITLPLLFAAYHSQPPDLQSMWFNHSPENRRNLARKWRKDAAFRCSQVGHVLTAAAKDRKSIVLEKTSQYSTGMWREQLFKKVFVTRDQQLKMTTSFFLTDQQLVEIVMRLPEKSDLLKYDEEAQLLYPDNLHNHIWIALNNRLSDVNFKVFEGLQYSIKHLKNCGAETLNLLDIHAFIYCATLCARSNLENKKSIPYFNLDKPKVLPAAITQELGTLNQNTFFRAAYRMYKNEYDSNMDQIRITLVEGIKILRCVDYTLDIHLLVTLANTFAERAKNLTKQSEIEANEARAELYWRTALPVLEKMKNNQAVSYTSNRLFNVKPKEMSSTDICGYIETGKLFSGVQLMKKKEHEKALRIFEVLKDPYASFYQAQIYKHMADQQTSQNKENVTSEMRSQNIILLSRARDCLYLTLDRLREPTVDPKHPLNAQLGTEIEKIERLLSRIDPDCTNRNECDGMSDENVSSNDSAGDHFVTGFPGNTTSYLGGNFTSRVDNQNNHSTPFRSDLTRREARPSPERLDAQLRQLTASKDAAISHILEHNKIMVESHRSLVDELRSFKEAVNNLTSTVDDLKTVKHSYEELKDIKKSVNELKQSIDELDNFKTVTDMVYEMKKEISELKKDLHKTNQLSEEDIYGLTNDYGTDYNINSNIAAYNSNLYQNYPARMPGAPSLYAPPPPLYPLYPPMGYPYAGLGLSQVPGGLPLAPEQQLTPDFRAISAALSQPTATYGGQTTHPNLNQSGLPSTTPLNMGLLAGQGLPQVAQPPTLFRDATKPNIPAPSGLTQTSFPTSSTMTVNPAVLASATATSRAPPVNVVITSSDPLPSSKTTVTQPVLSVTIPPQHLKGNLASKMQPHNYQIALTTSSVPSTSPSVLSKPPPIVTTQSLLQNIAPPVYSAVTSSTPPMNVSLGLQIEKSLDQTFNNSANKNDTSLNKSNNINSSHDEHDPCPDFKPIIPLPDEVPVTTGEEDEIVLFCERAKLYRHVNTNGNKEWKERGVGLLKILKNQETGKIRILMRRDQVHKICANHFLTNDMTLATKGDTAFMWAAHDFADEEMVVEKLCAKFKSRVEADKFFEAFEDAKKNLPPVQKDTAVEITKVAVSKDAKEDAKPVSSAGTTLGGFVFSSTPTFKPKDDRPVTSTLVQQETTTQSPFASFSFNPSTQTTTPVKLFEFKPFSAGSVVPTVASPTVITTPQKNANDDSHAEDFVPTAEFKPVIDLPELVEVKTGEENCEVLFESRAKLLRFDSSGETKEWKERGVGIMKILKDNTVRLVMRRDQIHKICCNHQLLKNMQFTVMTNNPKAITWCAKDFSEGVIKAETFAIRFKTEELASSFLKAVSNAQDSLDEKNYVSVSKHMDKHMKSEPTPKQPVGFGDKFKPAKGSWECKNCYINNEGKNNYCMACETPKNDSIPKKDSNTFSGAAFSFGVPSPNFQKAALPEASATNSWGNAFKPKEGSWECKSCYTRNDADKISCLSCEGPKEGIIPKKTPEKSVNLDTGGLKFSFGIPTTSQVNDNKPALASNWGDAFKPKEGSWECKSCLVRNNADTLYCLSCESPKDESIPKKEPTSTGINLSTPGQNFSFGIPKTSSVSADVGAKTTFTFGQSTIIPKAQFSFAAAKPDDKTNTSSSGTTSTFSFTPGVSIVPKPKEDSDQFVFGSPQKHDFEFVPRSPRRISTGQNDEESDNSYLEEECENIYFKPVIPLPDKVDVKTGEEDEDVLYCQRAKLFRFTSGEWKERGIGDLKILKKKDTNKLRVLMRREQVFKICLNHVLTTDIKYLPKDDKTWLFSAPDFSEGEICNDQFCVRFKNAEIAQEFIKAVKDALDGVSVDTKGKGAESNEEDDVKFIWETKVTADEEKEAVRLKLPPKFMSYRQLPDCKCEQCKKDDEYLKELFADNIPSKVIQKITPSNKPSDGGILVGSSPGAFAGGVTMSSSSTPKDASVNAFTAAAAASTAESFSNNSILKGLLNKPALFVAPKTTSSTSSLFDAVATSPAFSNTTPLSTGSNIFTTPASALSTAGKSSGNSLFGTPTASEQTPAMASFSFGAHSIQQQAANAASPSIFGNAAMPTKTSGGTLFGSGSNLFGGADSKNLFSTPTATGTTGASATLSFGSKPDGGALFSTPPATNAFGSTTGSIFGNSALGSSGGVSGGSIFGTGAAAPISTGSIFGGNSHTTQPPTSNLFAAPKAETIPALGSATTGSLFEKPSSNIFATAAAFAGTTNSTSNFGVSGGSLFGANSNLFGSTPPVTVASSEPPKTIFGEATNQTRANQSSITPSFGDGSVSISLVSRKADAPASAETTAGANKSTTELKEDDAVVLDCSTGLSFASLAANVSSDAPPAFAKDAKKDTSIQPFAFLGAGAPVFGSRTTDGKKSAATAQNKSTNSEDGGGDESTTAGGGDEEYDPHYEPIIPLPEAIVVSTGEEDETACFNERAKLYRYDNDNKEWKERGVGQMKILHHPVNNTYRFLLRREQVHKVVLNQLITPDLDLQPMTLSDKAWVWAGYNYVEDNAALEKLAVRFKNCELAQQFYKNVQEVLVKVKQIHAEKELNKSQQEQRKPNVERTTNVAEPEFVQVSPDLGGLPSSIQSYGQEDSNTSEDEHQQHLHEYYEEEDDDDDDDDEDGDDDEDEERTIMFMKRCTLSEEVDGKWTNLTMGDLQVYYDPDIYAARICISDDKGVVFSNTLIGMNTIMELKENTCTWRAVEWNDYGAQPHWRHLKATFSSEAAAEEFHSNYLEGLNYAQECDVVDEIPSEGVVGGEGHESEEQAE